MIPHEAYELSLEDKLNLRVFNDSVDNCKNVEELRENLKEVLRTYFVYKQLTKYLLTKHM